MRADTFDITDSITLLLFDEQRPLASSFMRFQEHYESPEFRGEVFTRDEYKEWYRETTGSFTYFEDWNGFNIPSNVLKPFYNGRFDPLTDQERSLLTEFSDQELPFYLIGTHRNTAKMTDYLRHETAHGLFHTDESYQEKALTLLSKHDTSAIKEELLSMSGYHPDVIQDEVHAYSIASHEKLDARFPEPLRAELQSIYEHHSIKHGVEFPNTLT
jgi:hypothetical protein